MLHTKTIKFIEDKYTRLEYLDDNSVWLYDRLYESANARYLQARARFIATVTYVHRKSVEKFMSYVYANHMINLCGFDIPEQLIFALVWDRTCRQKYNKFVMYKILRCVECCYESNVLWRTLYIISALSGDTDSILAEMLSV